MDTIKKPSQALEDYLESILMLSAEGKVVHRIDVAKRMGVSGAAVNKAMKILAEKAYIYEDGKHLYLTAEGKNYAESVYEKHCLIRDFLMRLGVSASVAQEDACHLEHLVSEETFLAVKAFMEK